MYLPKFNQVDDIGQLHGFIRQQPFDAWSTLANGEISVNHIPFMLSENNDKHKDGAHNQNTSEYGTLVGHVARANPIWQEFSTTQDSVIVFQGAQAYISPSWYPSKHQHGKTRNTILTG